MIYRIFIPCIFTIFSWGIYAQNEQIINVYNRETMNLNGEWYYIIDPYETGYFDYRLKPYDIREESIQENAPKGSFYANTKSENRWDRIEYDFDSSPTISNSQCKNA